MNEQNLSLKCCQSLDRRFINGRDLDLSKEVLWVSVDQRTAKLQAVKVGDLKKILPPAGVEPNLDGQGLSPGQWDHSQSLTDPNFAAL